MFRYKLDYFNFILVFFKLQNLIHYISITITIFQKGMNNLNHKF